MAQMPLGDIDPIPLFTSDNATQWTTQIEPDYQRPLISEVYLDDRLYEVRRLQKMVLGLESKLNEMATYTKSLENKLSTKAKGPASKTNQLDRIL